MSVKLRSNIPQLRQRRNITVAQQQYHSHAVRISLRHRRNITCAAAVAAPASNMHIPLISVTHIQISYHEFITMKYSVSVSGVALKAVSSQYSIKRMKFSMTELTLRDLGRSLPPTKLFSTQAVANSCNSPRK